jgi:hypothetical protein
MRVEKLNRCSFLAAKLLKHPKKQPRTKSPLSAYTFPASWLSTLFDAVDVRDDSLRIFFWCAQHGA